MSLIKSPEHDALVPDFRYERDQVIGQRHEWDRPVRRLTIDRRSRPKRQGEEWQ